MKGGTLDNVTIFKITPRVIPASVYPQMYDNARVGSQTVGYVNSHSQLGGKKLDTKTKEKKQKKNKKQPAQKKQSQ